MRRDARSEADVARLAVAELVRQGFETYEEVQTGRGSHRADIVGLRGALVVVVEVKATMSMALLDQMLAWRGFAHWIIGAAGGGKLYGCADRLCRLEGFGLWDCRFDVREVVGPKLRRYDTGGWLRRACVPENATKSEYAKAGTQGGGYYTPFRRTAKALADLVREQPGIKLRDALSALDHHYASDKTAMASMPALIDKGVVAGVKADRTARAIRLYPATEERA